MLQTTAASKQRRAKSATLKTSSTICSLCSSTRTVVVGKKMSSAVASCAANKRTNININNNRELDDDNNNSISSVGTQDHVVASTRCHCTNNDKALVIVTPTPKKKAPQVLVKDLCDLARADEDCIYNLANYVPDKAFDEDNSVNGLECGGANNGIGDDNNNIDVGPIFRSWAKKLLSTEDFVKTCTNFSIAEFQTLWIDCQHLVLAKWNVGSG